MKNPILYAVRQRLELLTSKIAEIPKPPSMGSATFLFCMEKEVEFLRQLLELVREQPCWEELDRQCVFLEAGFRIGLIQMDVPDPQAKMIRELKQKMREIPDEQRL